MYSVKKWYDSIAVLAVPVPPALRVLRSVSSEGFAFASFPVLPSSIFYFFHMIYTSKRYTIYSEALKLHTHNCIFSLVLGAFADNNFKSGEMPYI